MKQVMNYNKDNGLLNSEYDQKNRPHDQKNRPHDHFIRSEIGMRMRPIDNYARNDWALGSLSKSLGKGYLRVILNVLNSHR